tara:strand:+ start:14308 stop:14742 length:435 start_codon:yes stop_codon:yes gene_type:complete
MNFPNIRRNHFNKGEVDYLFAPTPVDVPIYDRLYELQNNLQHKYWQDFIEQYKLNCEFKNDLNDVDHTDSYILMWFFKERTDNGGKNEIVLNGAIEVSYLPNYILGFDNSKYKLKIKERSVHYPRRPFLQIYLKEDLKSTMFPW